MNKIALFNVAPAIPPQIGFIETLASNLWWCWNADAIELFRRINPQLWRDAEHNPLAFLRHVPQKRLETLSEDTGFLRHLQQVREHYEASVPHADNGRRVDPPANCIAYFSLEYGIHESVRLYSGGLGVLAGDHLKAASDLNLPLVAVGLLYRQGYFQQYLDKDGWQQERYPENEIHLLPITKACDGAHQQIHVVLPLPEGPLKAAIWRLDVGRIPLYLLDANVPENPPEFRNITAHLYEQDRQVRLRQELLLGIGGFRALVALGHNPIVCHINEGHAAFLSLARVEHMHKHGGLDMETVMEVIPRTNVFTTHTPVPAGNEAFSIDLLKPHIEVLRKEIGIDPARILAWGQAPNGDLPHEFSMTILGLRMAEHNNGVSQLHGQVARRMWRHLWPGRPDDEIPIRHITNGIHVSSWLSPDNGVLFDRYLGPDWVKHPAAGSILPHIAHIPDEELWRAHEQGRSRLIRTAREWLEKQCAARHSTRAEIAQSRSLLDQDALTIGFARRFAGYKRATLLLRDPERLAALLSNDERPVQIIMAGKAHPADANGKNLIKQIVDFARRADVRRHIVFLEDYDIYTARCLVQGVDVWLNTPRRSHEASGTSGMKAAVNGVLNVSILDGWWCEGYERQCGWAIGHGEDYDDVEYQDAVESQALFNLLENEVVPCFYDREQGDLPTAWIRMMKASIRMALGQFTSHRMVAEYEALFYEPARRRYDSLLADNGRLSRELLAQHKRFQSLWHGVRVQFPSANRDVSVTHVGDTFTVTCQVHLGDLTPREVDVQVYYGPVDSMNQITESHVQEMNIAKELGNGAYTYISEISCQTTGRFGFTARAQPRGTEWKHVIPGFMAWANGMGS